MNKQSIFVCLILFCMLGCKKSPWSEFEEIPSIITFERSISNGGSLEIFQMKNGDYVVNNRFIGASYPKIIKLDQYGNLIDSLMLNDGKYLTRMILDADNKIVFAGTQKQGPPVPSPFNDDRPIIARYNPDLTLESSFVINKQNFGAKNLKTLEGIVETQNRNFIFWGKYSNNLYEATSTFFGTLEKDYSFLNITDSLKNIFLSEYVPLTINGDKIYAITDNNELLIINTWPQIIKKVQIGGPNDEFLGLTVLSSGKVVISGGHNGIPILEIRDKDGILEKTKNLTDIGYIDLVETTDGNIMLLGFIYSPDTDADIVLTKVDANLEKIGEDKIFKRKGYDIGLSIIHTNDGGFMIAGETTRNGPRQIYLIKTDSNGDIR